MNDNGTRNAGQVVVQELDIAICSDLRRQFECLLCNGGALIAVDPMARELKLPLPLLGGTKAVILDYDLDAVIPIPDLEATDEGIGATLSFSREPFATFVPWSAVLAMAAKQNPVAPPNKHDGRPKLRLV